MGCGFRFKKKKETESLLMVVQDQTLAAKAYRVTILKQQSSKNFSMSNERWNCYAYPQWTFKAGSKQV